MQEPFWITNFTAFLGISHTYYNIWIFPHNPTIKHSAMLNARMLIRQIEYITRWSWGCVFAHSTRHYL